MAPRTRVSITNASGAVDYNDYFDALKATKQKITHCNIGRFALLREDFLCFYVAEVNITLEFFSFNKKSVI